MKLLQEENDCVTWQALKYNLPRTVMSFAARSWTDSLATPANLKRWGKKVSDKCNLCGNKGTLKHVLNFCNISLNQFRFNFRHDSVLNHIYKTIKPHISNNMKIYCDLPGQRINSGTIPSHILPSSQIPDLVLVQDKALFIMELTCPFPDNVDKAHQYKINKYANLIQDIEERGFKANCYCIEVSSLGNVNSNNKLTLRNFLKDICIQGKVKASNLITDLSKISLLTSYSIYKAHCEPHWSSTELLNK